VYRCAIYVRETRKVVWTLVYVVIEMKAFH
jgi:hypothetical protein